MAIIISITIISLILSSVYNGKKTLSGVKKGLIVKGHFIPHPQGHLIPHPPCG